MDRRAFNRGGRPRLDQYDDDPIRRGWPGPMAGWSDEMWATFKMAEQDALDLGLKPPSAFAEAWGAVVEMREGRA